MAEIVVIVTLSYFAVLFVLSRRQRPVVLPAPADLMFAFVIPCLNEERVLEATLDNLVPLLRGDDIVLVVDDGSDDRTRDIVQEYESPRVHLLRRELPNARHGKGDALNAAIRHLHASDLLGGRPHDEVVVAVFDADGRLAPEAIDAVSGYFRDPRMGAVQIGVVMRNAQSNLLARLQDMEFTVFTEIFQRARQLIGSVGLGGNGQFVRLSALDSLGEAPWTDCLTEDLDLGVRLLLGGWRNNYCPTVCVDQQAVTELPRWIRQRTRWFQGHLQCWRLIPAILHSSLRGRPASDIIWYLTLPVAVLLIPVAVLPLTFALLLAFIAAPGQVISLLTANHGMPLILAYVLCFGQAYPYAFVYWLRGRMGLGRAILLAHAFEMYSHLWLIAGWLAMFRVLRRKRGWDKTARVVEPVPAAEAP
jgi:cellulose synthase/poly-beta-1,6-N-acetylglucosamine synthase-like glycosyltransferase